MKPLLWAVSGLALLLTIVPPALFAAGSIAETPMKNLMLGATVLWFIVWPLAIRRGETEKLKS